MANSMMASKTNVSPSHSHVSSIILKRARVTARQLYTVFKTGIRNFVFSERQGDIGSMIRARPYPRRHRQKSYQVSWHTWVCLQKPGHMANPVGQCNFSKVALLPIAHLRHKSSGDSTSRVALPGNDFKGVFWDKTVVEENVLMNV